MLRCRTMGTDKQLKTQIECKKPAANLHTVVTIPENLPLSTAKKPVLSKGLNFVPISKKTNEFTTRQDVEKLIRHVQVKAFFHDKDQSDTTEKDAFETITTRKSKWTPPEGQFESIDYFNKKCRHYVRKLKFNCNTKLSNLSKEEWTALINLKNRNDLVIKAADKDGATVVWRTDLYQQEAVRQLSDPTFHTRPNFCQPKNCQRHHSRTHNKTITTCHRSESHHHYS